MASKMAARAKLLYYVLIGIGIRRFPLHFGPNRWLRPKYYESSSTQTLCRRSNWARWAQYTRWRLEGRPSSVNGL